MKSLLEILRQFKRKKAPISAEKWDFSKSRHLEAQQSRHLNKLCFNEIASDVGFAGSPRNDMAGKITAAPRNDSGEKSEELLACPYCNSKDTIKKGFRKKKYESQQRFLCNACGRLFVAPKAKGKSFPLKVILEAISYYNTGFTLAESCRFLKEKSGLDVKEASLSNWLDEMDVEHMQEALNFKIPLKLDRVLTGHIDILQVRNGAIHILDYKPEASQMRFDTLIGPDVEKGDDSIDNTGAGE